MQITTATIVLPVLAPQNRANGSRNPQSPGFWASPGLSRGLQGSPIPSIWPQIPKPDLRPSKPTSGPAAEGVALKIRRTPAGVAGRDENSVGFCINACFREPASAAGPSKLEPKMHHFSSLNFSTPFFKQNLQNMRKASPKGTPFGA